MVDDDVQQLRDQVVRLSAANAALEERVRELASDDLSSLQAEVEELSADNERLDTENAELENRVDELEGLIDLGLEQQLDELEAENEALENRVNELESQLDGGLEEEVDELQQTVDALEADNQELRGRVDELAASAEYSRRSVATADDERVYVASKTRPHFHRPSCEWASYIPRYKLVEYSTHAEAVAAGKKPCKTCRA
jgi:chromosome segregation ATPase